MDYIETQDALNEIELLPPKVICALARLGKLLPPDVIVPLPELVAEVIARTGYGDVGIVISEHRAIAAHFEMGFPRAKNNK